MSPKIPEPAGTAASMVAVTITVPAAFVVRVFPLMVAPVVPALFTDHTIVLLVALEGTTVPERAMGVPATPLVGTPVIPVTATKVDPPDDDPEDGNNLFIPLIIKFVASINPEILSFIVKGFDVLIKLLASV